MAELTAPIRDKSKDIIEAGTLRPAWGTGVVAVLAAIVTAWDPLVEKLLGKDPEIRHKLILLAMATGAWVLLAGVDMIARAYATAHVAGSDVVGAPAGMKAKKTKGTDETGYTVSAIRVKPDADKPEFLLVKAGKGAAWVGGDDLEFT